MLPARHRKFTSTGTYYRNIRMPKPSKKKTKKDKRQTRYMQMHKRETARKKPNTKKKIYTAMPLFFHPPGPLQAHTHSPIATQTETAMAQNVGA